jgi:hypothetical protein
MPWMPSTIALASEGFARRPVMPATSFAKAGSSDSGMTIPFFDLHTLKFPVIKTAAVSAGSCWVKVSPTSEFSTNVFPTSGE